MSVGTEFTTKTNPLLKPSNQTVKNCTLIPKENHQTNKNPELLTQQRLRSNHENKLNERDEAYQRFALMEEIGHLNGRR